MKSLAIKFGRLASKVLVCPDKNDIKEDGADDKYSHSNPAPPVKVCEIQSAFSTSARAKQNFSASQSRPCFCSEWDSIILH